MLVILGISGQDLTHHTLELLVGQTKLMGNLLEELYPFSRDGFLQLLGHLGGRISIDFLGTAQRRQYRHHTFVVVGVGSRNQAGGMLAQLLHEGLLVLVPGMLGRNPDGIAEIGLLVHKLLGQRRHILDGRQCSGATDILRQGSAPIIFTRCRGDSGGFARSSPARSSPINPGFFHFDFQPPEFIHLVQPSSVV